VSIWFNHLTTDWFALRRVDLKKIPFVLRSPVRGRMIITAANTVAEAQGIRSGMMLADARAIVPDLEVADDDPSLVERLLTKIGVWCIRFTPVVAIDPPDGLILDVTGCSHLWGGDESYVGDITKKIHSRGYDVRVAMADTIGVAWGAARFGKGSLIVAAGDHQALMSLPSEALRLEGEVIDRLYKLGLREVSQFIRMPRQALRRRFGQSIIMRLDMALGQQMELITPLQPIEPYQERLPCLEPIVTAVGIEIALRKLLEALCFRLHEEQKGLRASEFKGYRVDGKVEKISIGTNHPSHNVEHLFKLFEPKLSTLEPALGIELFVLDALRVEQQLPKQEKVWEASGGLDDLRLSELLDRLANRAGSDAVHRYLPDEHYWPERSIKVANALLEKPNTPWLAGRLRPLQLLRVPERIEVTAPIPDYPPMLFRYHGNIHEIVRADGPERIEQEWWVEQGQHRDYYRVEDAAGRRYWIFRLGHYREASFQWFVHGFFA